MTMKEFDHKITTFGIRNRILIFTLIVTLIPSLGLGWAFYIQTKKLLQTKVGLELHYNIKEAQRETGLWFKENAFNVRVFSNSFVISENLARFIKLRQSGDSNAPKQMATSIEIIREYLLLVQSQFQEYQRLLLLDNTGIVIAQSTDNKKEFTLPVDWQKQLEQNKMVLGETNNDDLSAEATFLIATPVFSNNQEFLGLLATESNIHGLKSVLKLFTLSGSTHFSLINRDGSVLVSTTRAPEAITTDYIKNSNLDKLYNNPMELSTYISAYGTKVVGVFAPLHHLSWGIVMEKNYDKAFAGVLELKNLTLTMIAILLTFVGIAAFVLSYSILSPLKQLIKGAFQVADGDLNVKLPVTKRDELGFTISVFNDMVVRLRKNHNELEKLATVDSLTGLFNRKHLMKTLAWHIKRYARHQTAFSILMTDLDHFKQVNDRYGHPAGDAVLVNVGKIFNNILRSIDTAGRYGGEEFLIILDNTQEQEAQQTAERIRQAVENSEITVEGKTIKVTISVGVATINSTISRTCGQLIGTADKALYEAKQGGRNRVFLFTSKNTKADMEQVEQILSAQA